MQRNYFAELLSGLERGFYLLSYSRFAATFTSVDNRLVIL